VALTRANGIYHVAGDWPGGFTTPYNFARKIAKKYKLDALLIRPILFKDYAKDKLAPRPQHTWLDTKKIKKLKLKLDIMSAEI